MRAMSLKTGFAIVFGLVLAGSAGHAQQATPSGADLRGIWVVQATANWNVEGHEGAEGVAPSRSIIVAPSTGRIPYRPEAAARRQAVKQEDDPQLKCFAPGVPRAAYTPRPLQIFQTDSYVVIAYEELNKSRIIQLSQREHRDGVELWMGDSLGRWDGNTLVADVRALTGQTWFDKAGNFHSEDMRVIERYTRTGPNTLQYEATMTDPKTFTEPWTIRLTLERQTAPGARLGYQECATDQAGRRVETPSLR